MAWQFKGERPSYAEPEYGPPPPTVLAAIEGVQADWQLHSSGLLLVRLLLIWHRRECTFFETRSLKVMLGMAIHRQLPSVVYDIAPIAIVSEIILCLQQRLANLLYEGQTLLAYRQLALDLGHAIIYHTTLKEELEHPLADVLTLQLQREFLELTHTDPVLIEIPPFQAAAINIKPSLVAISRQVALLEYEDYPASIIKEHYGKRYTELAELFLLHVVRGDPTTHSMPLAAVTN